MLMKIRWDEKTGAPIFLTKINRNLRWDNIWKTGELV